MTQLKHFSSLQLLTSELLSDPYKSWRTLDPCCRNTNPHIWPGGSSIATVRALEHVGTHMRPLVALHLRPAVEGGHADLAGELLGVELLTGGGGRGGGGGLAAELGKESRDT